MRTDEDWRERAFDIVRESSFYLWQSLLTINGLYITLIIGISSFFQVDENTRVILFVILVLLSFSSFILVANFSTTKDTYFKIATLSNDDIPSANDLIKKAVQNYNLIKRNENIALIISGIVTLILVFSLLFVLPKH